MTDAGVIDAETGELLAADPHTLATLTKATMDQMLLVAVQRPRSVTQFIKEASNLVTLTEQIAQECMYAIPRAGKTIEGPSARFAEIVLHSWKNARAGARVVDIKGGTVVAQGIFHDLETNTEITKEVERRITDKRGRRFSDDMIAVTGNAACSIALRNAILAGVPKAFWEPMYLEARKTAVGDAKTLASKRADALDYLQKFGVTGEMICTTLERDGIEDIKVSDLALLRGFATALRDGEETVESLFPPVPPPEDPHPRRSEEPPTDESRSGAAAAKAALAGD